MNSHASSLLNSSTLCLLVPLAITYLHVLLSPYTKVEESFTLHVVHDVLVHGLDIGKWDHVTFPGAVPRSFAPGIVLGVMAWGPVRLATALGLVRCKVDVQIIGKLGALVQGPVFHLYAGCTARPEMCSSAIDWVTSDRPWVLNSVSRPARSETSQAGHIARPTAPRYALKVSH